LQKRETGLQALSWSGSVFFLFIRTHTVMTELM